MSKSKHVIRSDLKRVDAHVVQPHEYDDAPELTDEQLANAVLSVGVRPPGRPKSDNKKTAVSLRLDADVVAAFRGTGVGWQTRINDTLRAKLKDGKVVISTADKKPRNQTLATMKAKRKRA